MEDLNVYLNRRDLLRATGSLAIGGAALSFLGDSPAYAGSTISERAPKGSAKGAPSENSIMAYGKLDKIVADPRAVPPPIPKREPTYHEITLESQEIVAEVDGGKSFRYMTFGGQVPGPMIRIRQGDTVEFTLKNLSDSTRSHNIDFHAVYGTGGGSDATLTLAGQSNGMIFKALYPGCFIYHCAVPNLDYHISSGMFGLILVEPREGLPPVDHELYLGQHELYATEGELQMGDYDFDFNRMEAENPTHVLLQGASKALTPQRAGPIHANVGETTRVYFVNGGPNLTSNFHPIGNVWTKAWGEGALKSAPERNVQTMAVPPGSCGVFEMDFPVPETIKLVDHALSRVVRKGMLGIIDVAGAPRPEVFDPTLPENTEAHTKFQ